jgi:hypothetical protein
MNDIMIVKPFIFDALIIQLSHIKNLIKSTYCHI